MSKKYRTLTGPDLTVQSECNIFENIISKDYETNNGFVNEKKEISYNGGVISSINEFTTTSNNFLSITYNNDLVSNYTINDKKYNVVQKNVIQGHLLGARGYVLTDYWDDTSFENFDLDNGNLLLVPGYIDSNYPFNNISSSEIQRLDVLYNAGTNNHEPISTLKYSTYSYSSEDDVFIFVKYNPDMPLVNTFYLGEKGPLQHFIAPSKELQPYIHSITISNFDRSSIKEYYQMYYGLNISGNYDSNKIYKVEKYINSALYSTFYYDYDNNSNIISIREELYE